MSAYPARVPMVDAMKAFASQLIVLHHLAFYGPMSDVAHSLAPTLLDWLSSHARIAVQVFLVVGGFLAAKNLVSQSEPIIERPLKLVWNRYCRLAMPYMAAIGLAIACAAIARAWVPLETTPAGASAPQLLAHLLLLQDLLGYEALSAGVWYVAIDFQLYALMVFLLWLTHRSGIGKSRLQRLVPALMYALTILSLFHFNRNGAWDAWALYFFGAYGLGVLACWASLRQRPSLWLGMIAAIGLASLLVDFRSRIAVALATALLLGFARHPIVARYWRESSPITFLGRISYSVFLVHYPVGLVINAMFVRIAPNDAFINAIGLVICWIASVLAGALFHRHVELPAGTWLARRADPRLAGNPGTAR